MEQGQCDLIVEGEKLCLFYRINLFTGILMMRKVSCDQMWFKNSTLHIWFNSLNLWGKWLWYNSKGFIDLINISGPRLSRGGYLSYLVAPENHLKSCLTCLSISAIFATNIVSGWEGYVKSELILPPQCTIHMYSCTEFCIWLQRIHNPILLFLNHVMNLWPPSEEPLILVVVKVIL